MDVIATWGFDALSRLGALFNCINDVAMTLSLPILNDL